MIHPLAWLSWLTATLVALSSTRNPLYLLAGFGCLLVLYHRLPPAPDAPRVPLSPLRFGLIVVLVSGLFNALSVHIGNTVLFTLPPALPLIGGNITLEALVYGMLNGLLLTGIFTAFSILTQMLSAREIVQLIPPAFYPMAVVAAIALNFVPVTLKQWQAIREAQAIRGHRLRGWRDSLPLFLPLLIGGLEQALNLAEAMTARGFAHAPAAPPPRWPKLSLILGLLAFVGGWLLQILWQQAVLGLSLLIGGVLTVLLGLWKLGQQSPRTRYRPQPWRKTDWALLGLNALIISLFLFPLFDQSSIFYYPYPALNRPTLHPAFFGTTLGLLGPLIISYSDHPRFASE